MTYAESLILGIVEGITEFLPISSTGHLILVSEFLKIGNQPFVKSFEIIIQLGAIFSVIFLYRRSFLDIEILKKIMVGFLPTGVIGLVLYKAIKVYFIGNHAMALWALFIGGFALIIFEFWHQESEDGGKDLAGISYKQALWIGLCQSAAIIPGVSRSAASIVGGLLAGLKRKTIVEFSFLLAVHVLFQLLPSNPCEIIFLPS